MSEGRCLRTAVCELHGWYSEPGLLHLQVPACYRQPAPRLKPGYFSKFQQDTLFYIFYSMPADEAQVFAADELASRGWWFHKELKVRSQQSPLLTNLV